MKRAYINGIILDGSENMQPQKGMSIITDGEKIVGIVPAGSEGGLREGRSRRQVYYAGAYKPASAPACLRPPEEKAGR